MASEDKMADSEIPYLIIDSSATLTNRKFAKDLDAVLGRAKDSGVQKVIVRATNVQTSREALRLCRLHPQTLFCCSGITAHETKDWSEESSDQLTELLKNPECVAAGECGLDFSRDFGSSPATQLEALDKVLEIVSKLNQNGVQRPLLLICRNAHNELIGRLREFESRGLSSVVLRFSGSKEEGLQYLSRGYYLSLNGLLGKDKADNGVRGLLADKAVSIKQIVVESDSPWSLPNARAQRLPEHVRNAFTTRAKQLLNRYCSFQRNEPCCLSVTIEMIASLMDIKAEELALQSTYNCLKVFDLKV